MLNWKNWCRLCGNFEVSDKIEPDIEHLIEQILDIPTDNNCICIDCNAYVHEFQSFITKSREITGMFEELDQKESSGEINDDYVLQLRQIFNLPLPEIAVYVPNDDEALVEDFADIENFKIEDDSTEVDEAYVMSDEQFDRSGGQQEPESERDEMKDEQNEIMEICDDGEFIYQYVEDEEENSEAKDQESDEISKHFKFRCHICNEKYHKMCFLTIHTKTTHDCLPRVECTCGGFLGSVKALINHYENHVKQTPNLQCELCNKWYKTETHFESHMLTRHSGGDDGKRFTCECGKSFKEARHLTVHANSHLPDDLKFIHLCTYCDKRYSSIFSLRQHIKHVHVKEPTFECVYCGKMFSRKANLDSHIKHVHTEDRNFECVICGLKVKTKGILRVHMKLHSTNPDDLMTCNVCQRQFKTRNQLTNHMICHSIEKKFKCSLCSAEYKRSKELTSHMASSHMGVTKYACEWCPKTFNNNSNYRKHKLKMHPKELGQAESSAKEQEFYYEEIE